jgi:hypothetical protein
MVHVNGSLWHPATKQEKRRNGSHLHTKTGSVTLDRRLGRRHEKMSELLIVLNRLEIQLLLKTVKCGEWLRNFRHHRERRLPFKRIALALLSYGSL